MILDSSAVIAVITKEPEYSPILNAMVQADQLGIGAPTLTETGIVLTARLGISGKTLLSRFVQEAELEIIAFTDDHWSIAIDAYFHYGKGRHPAALNFGDCLTYGIAKRSQRPLLCLGNDFAQTDLALGLHIR
jgi:ribonuclease VapC